MRHKELDIADVEIEIQGVDYFSRVRRLNRQAFGKNPQKTKVSTVTFIAAIFAVVIIIIIIIGKIY